VNIACAIDEGYAQHCGVMLCSLFSNSAGTKFQVFVVTDGLTAKSRERLARLARDWNQTLVFVHVDVQQFRDAAVSGHITIGAYFRLVLPQILPADVDKVLVLDADIVVQGSLTELYDQEVDRYTHAAVKNPLCGSVHRRHPRTLGMPEGSEYFNAGMLLLNVRRWREEGIADRLIKYAAINADKLRWWHQDALNGVLHDRWKSCHPIWNAQSTYFCGKSAEELGMSDEKLLEIRTNARLVHFCGTSKPWSFYSAHPLKNEYFKYLALTPWRGYRPVDRPPAWLRARLLASRITPEFAKQGYRRLAGRRLAAEP
jgi:lipopolysaccharide biosynthesis glycosyltransferase